MVTMDIKDQLIHVCCGNIPTTCHFPSCMTKGIANNFDKTQVN